MNNELEQHPAIQFGKWLKNKRRESGVVSRIFAVRIGLSPAEYCEVESGIVRWIQSKQENLISIMLKTDADGEAEFHHKLYLAKEANALEFADVYSREELAPARCCTVNSKQIDAATREAILKAVFTPL